MVKKFRVIKDCPCLKTNHYMYGPWQLFESLEYEPIDYQLIDGFVQFSLHDEHGWIGDYQIDQTIFKNNCTVIE